MKRDTPIRPNARWIGAFFCLATAAIQPCWGQGVAPAPRYPSVKTPMGALSVSQGALTLGSEQIADQASGRYASHLSTHYVYPQQTDVLVQYSGGTSCPALFRWYSITATSIIRSPEFGNCSDQISIEKGSDQLTVIAASFGPAAINGRYVYDGRTLRAYEPLGTAAASKTGQAQRVWRAASASASSSAYANPSAASPSSPPAAAQRSAAPLPRPPQPKTALASYYTQLKNNAARQQGAANSAWHRVQQSQRHLDERYKSVPFDPDADPLFFVKMAQIMQCEVREGLTHEIKGTLAQFWQFPGGCMDDGRSQAFGAVIVLFPNGTGRLGVLMSPGAADRVLRELHGG